MGVAIATNGRTTSSFNGGLVGHAPMFDEQRLQLFVAQLGGSIHGVDLALPLLANACVWVCFLCQQLGDRRDLLTAVPPTRTYAVCSICVCGAQCVCVWCLCVCVCVFACACVRRGGVRRTDRPCARARERVTYYGGIHWQSVCTASTL